MRKLCIQKDFCWLNLSRESIIHDLSIRWYWTTETRLNITNNQTASYEPIPFLSCYIFAYWWNLTEGYSSIWHFSFIIIYSKVNTKTKGVLWGAWFLISQFYRFFQMNVSAKNTLVYCTYGLYLSHNRTVLIIFITYLACHIFRNLYLILTFFSFIYYIKNYIRLSYIICII